MSKRLHNTRHGGVPMSGPRPWAYRAARRRATAVVARGLLVYFAIFIVLAVLAACRVA
jgi:hypothetical protein